MQMALRADFIRVKDVAAIHLARKAPKSVIRGQVSAVSLINKSGSNGDVCGETCLGGGGGVGWLLVVVNGRKWASVDANGRKWALLISREGWEGGEEIENLEPLARSHGNSGENKFLFGANECKRLQTGANERKAERRFRERGWGRAFGDRLCAHKKTFLFKVRFASDWFGLPRFGSGTPRSDRGLPEVEPMRN